MCERRVAISAPPVVDIVKLTDPRHTISCETPSGLGLVFYDPLVAVGALFLFEPGMWAIYGPMRLGAFVATLKARGIVITNGESLARWLEAAELEIELGELN